MSRPTTELAFETAFAEELGELYPREGAGPGTRRTRAEIHDEVHELFRPSALCLSGGGIRSATFALGVVQGLARRGLLQGFQYLSTVSGGGYLGGWLTAWIHRHPDGLEGVCRDLAGPEPEPVRHLRSYSNYLTPRLGLLSADSWTLAATLLRNLLLNWCVLVPLLLAVVAVPWLAWAVQALGSSSALPSWLPTTTAALGFALAVKAVAYLSVEQPGAGIQPADDCGRTSPPQDSRDQSAFLLSCWLPLLASAVCLTTYWGWVAGRAEAPGGFQFTAFVAGAHVTGWLLSLLKRRRPPGVFDGLVALVSGAVGGIGAWLAVSHAGLGAGGDARLYVWLAVPVFLGLFLIAGSAYVALATSRMEDDEREWAARLGAWVLLAAVAWAVAFPLVLFGPDWLDGARGRLGFGSIGGLSGLVAVLLGGSSATPARNDGEGDGKRGPRPGAWLPLLAGQVPKVAAPIFLVCLAPVLSWLLVRVLMPGFTATIEAMAVASSLAAPGGTAFAHTPEGRVVGFAALSVALVLFGGGASRYVNVNKYSLHSMYRSRLIRAYLGASRSADRRPNRFTGFDPADNMGMTWLRGPNCAGRPRRTLFPVVNCALNLVTGDELAWQQRKAEPFTISPLHSGSARVGYRRSAEYGSSNNRAISLGTAMAISGAAASPNMGYHSSGLVTFLMTLFNARLGWWLGNPGPAGEGTYTQSHPKCTLKPLLDEALGLTNDDNPYVYLSDGGHFDNLGLYEMVRRRCHLIVVSDAGCDPRTSREDLGGAVRKIRIDLGVSVDFEEMSLGADGKDEPARFALGRIRYSDADGPHAPDGLLLHLRPALRGDEPVDVLSYARACPRFPHETTGDQWFSESQFESYRMLGLHTVESVLDRLGKPEPATVESLERAARSWIRPIAPDVAA